MKTRKPQNGNIQNQANEIHQNNNSKPFEGTMDDFTGDFNIDTELIKQKLSPNSDVHFRHFYMGNTEIPAMLIYVEGLSDKDLIEKHIMKSLMTDFSEQRRKEAIFEDGRISIEYIKNKILPVSDIKEIQNISDLVLKVLTGWAALLLAGKSDIIIIDTAKGIKRTVEEPSSEALVRGPRVGFTESLSDNTAILRGLGENSHLFLTKFQVGKTSKKELVIAYIEGIANPEIVEEVKDRIQRINIDYVPESGYIEQLIEDNYLSPFPQVQSTERPDRVMGALMEGRVAILLDGTPFALIVPVTLSMLLQSPEDYYERWVPGTLIRLLRFLAAFISLLAPALYIAFISFHPGMIPTKLVMSIAETREGVPFPAIIEALIMEVSVEILREAGLRLPRPIGPAIGIVGGLVIGEAAVQAGIVSPIMVIVVAITAISSFAIPQYSIGISLRFFRFIAMFSAALLGLYGITLFMLLMGSYLVRLKSFGIPYVSPAAPYRDWKDFMVRMPLFMMKSRPKMLQSMNPKRKG
ncbi:MAG: spore germination protein [Bacillota bacterium]|nr:spore germination protein [Bacillota bacterium]